MATNYKQSLIGSGPVMLANRHLSTTPVQQAFIEYSLDKFDPPNMNANAVTNQTANNSISKTPEDSQSARYASTTTNDNRASLIQ